MNIPYVNPRERDAEQLLKLLHPKLGAGERSEIRHKRPGENRPMSRKFFANSMEAARYAVSLVHEDVYVGVAARRGEDGTKAGVARLRVLWADLDLKHGHTRQSRLQQLNGLPCYPSMLVWSGGGWHPYWLLKEPTEGLKELEKAELMMQRLAEGLDGDPVHDCSRIMRVPGTFNHKYGEPRLAKLQHCDSQVRYGLGQLREMAEALPKNTEDGPRHGGKVRRDVLSGSIREGGRNVALASIAGSLRGRGLDPETMCMVLLEVNRLRCEPSLGEFEVVQIANSVARYPAGNPRYRRSSARRVYRKGTS